MKRLLLLYTLLVIPFFLLANDKNFTGSLEGKWQAHDISISMDGIPKGILVALAQQIKDDPSTECVKKSVIEVKKGNKYALTNACEANGNLSGTWKLNGDKLVITFSKYPNASETIIVKSITEDTITVDVTDRVPSDFEFNGKKPTLHLILKRL